MQIKIKDNIKQFSKGLTKFEKKQIPFATAQGINSTLFGLKKEMSKQAEKKLDRPTPATKKGFFNLIFYLSLVSVLIFNSFLNFFFHYFTSFNKIISST